MMSDIQVIEYRRLVSSLAASLSAEEVERVAYIRLKDAQRSPDKYNAKEPSATGLSLLATLERLGVFSLQNVDGLLEIAKDVGRGDLMNHVEEYKRRSHAAYRVRKKPRRGLSEDQQHLGQTFEMMVTKLAALEQHVSLLQRTLDGENDMQDESLELLRNTEKIVQDLASKLQGARQKLSTRFLTNSNSSCSSGSVGGSTVSSPVDTINQPPPPQEESWTNCFLQPVPKQRKRLPMQVSITQTGKMENIPFEYEDKGYAQAITSKKRPMFPKKAVTQLATRNSGSHGTNYQLQNGHVNDGMEDNTGDSGRGTGSETGPYSTVEIWREAMKNPPPDSSKHMYQSINSENREADTVYKVIERKRKVAQ